MREIQPSAQKVHEKSGRVKRRTNSFHTGRSDVKEATEKANIEPIECSINEELRVRKRSSREEEEERCTDRVYKRR